MNNNLALLKEAIEITSPNYTSILEKVSSTTGKTITLERFCLALLNNTLPFKYLEISESTYSRLTKRLYPNKKSNTKLSSFILGLVGLKYCPKCQNIKEVDLFHANSNRAGGYSSHCKECCGTRTEYQRVYQAKRRAIKIHRTPRWSETEEIKQFYNNCPEGFHVDHIIPLQGTVVSGLHVLSNLQYLEASDNCSKGNRFNIVDQ